MTTGFIGVLTWIIFESAVCRLAAQLARKELQLGSFFEYDELQLSFYRDVLAPFIRVNKAIRDLLFPGGAWAIPNYLLWHRVFKKI